MRDEVPLRFRDDPRLYHLRVIVGGPLPSDGAYYVLTPDRRVKKQFLDEATVADIVLFKGDLGFYMVATDCYRDVDTKHGRFLPVEVSAAIWVAQSRIKNQAEIDAGRRPERKTLDDKFVLDAPHDVTDKSS